MSTNSLQSENEIIIHPNDGFDLGLMYTNKITKIFLDTLNNMSHANKDRFMNGYIKLENNCQLGSISIMGL